MRLVSAPQSQEPSVQNEKCGCEKCREDQPLQAYGLPEYFGVTERPEPEGVDVIRQYCAATEKDDRKNGKDKQKYTPARRLPLPQMDRFSHSIPPLAPYLVRSSKRNVLYSVCKLLNDTTASRSATEHELRPAGRTDRGLRLKIGQECRQNADRGKECAHVVHKG